MIDGALAFLSKLWFCFPAEKPSHFPSSAGPKCAGQPRWVHGGQGGEEGGNARRRLRSEVEASWGLRKELCPVLWVQAVSFAELVRPLV